MSPDHAGALILMLLLFGVPVVTGYLNDRRNDKADRR